MVKIIGKDGNQVGEMRKWHDDEWIISNVDNNDVRKIVLEWGDEYKEILPVIGGAAMLLLLQQQS